LRRCGLDASGPDREQWRALVKTVVSLRVPWKFVDFLTSWGTISF
jgi:hypothetical protein